MRIIIRRVIDARDYPGPAYAQGMPILDRVLRLCRRAFFQNCPYRVAIMAGSLRFAGGRRSNDQR